MKSVFSAQHSIEAHLVKGMLESYGIEAMVAGDHLQGGIGELPAFGVCEVKVAAADEQRARAIIHEYQTGEAPDGELEA